MQKPGDELKGVLMAARIRMENLKASSSADFAFMGDDGSNDDELEDQRALLLLKGAQSDMY